MARRRLSDRMRRLVEPSALPPTPLLANIQLTPWVSEYLEVGRRSARSIHTALHRAGVRNDAEVLDFGCGSARTLRHLRGKRWGLHGCDIDAEAVRWAAEAFPEIDLRATGTNPPLPWSDSSFDAVWAVSVFTHFDETSQTVWLAELARLLRGGGVLLISTMGPRVLGAFADHDTAANRRDLDSAGFIFRSRDGSFNEQAAFHTAAGVTRLAAPWFELEEWIEGGLDGFQDVSVLRKR